MLGDGRIIEQIAGGTFAVYDLRRSEVTYSRKIETDEAIYRPLDDDYILKGGLFLPDRLIEYGDDAALDADIDACIRTAREVRQAQNFIIQSTAADMAKTAMVRVHSALPEGARLIVMVHDEFIVECRRELAEDVRSLMVKVMQATPESFIVPMVVEAKIAGRWGDALAHRRFNPVVIQRRFVSNDYREGFRKGYAQAYYQFAKNRSHHFGRGY